jgi:uncharacterized iron-regulated membrane protein
VTKKKPFPPTDVVRTYIDVHSWVGIIAGLALFIAFYAGAITMFETPLQRWATAPTQLAPPPSLEQTPALVAKVLAAHPKARKSYQVHLVTSPEQPARVSWTTGTRRAPGPTYYASLAADGALQVTTREPSPVAELIDVLHQQVGLPFDHETAMPIMGVIALLYAVAIISGIIALLPSLVKDLFALRLGKNVKRMWLDLHNLLGVFSLPFHIIMALTAVIFAFHDQIYDAQGAVSRIGAAPPAKREAHGPPPSGAVLPPAELARRIEAQLPGFRLHTISYENNSKEGVHARIQGADPRYGARGPTYTIGEVDPRDGRITEADYLPRLQDGWFATIVGFFALHFGSYGGAPVRWAYFFLGLAGAFLFYSGNLLWIESRRRKARERGAVEQTRSSHVLGALTVGISLGCIAGISVTIAAAKWLPRDLADSAAWHAGIYYAVFLAAVAWAFARGAARAGGELLWACAATTALIPLTSLTAGAVGGWNHGAGGWLVDATALVGALAFAVMARAAHLRAANGPMDSVWSSNRASPVSSA